MLFIIIQASDQGDLLSDLILDDILEDTAQAMQRMERRVDIEQQAVNMEEAPTIEGLLQTLDIMEVSLYDHNQLDQQLFVNIENLTSDSSKIKGNSGYCRFWTPVVYFNGINCIDSLRTIILTYNLSCHQWVSNSSCLFVYID